MNYIILIYRNFTLVERKTILTNWRKTFQLVIELVEISRENLPKHPPIYGTHPTYLDKGCTIHLVPWASQLTSKKQNLGRDTVIAGV